MTQVHTTLRSAYLAGPMRGIEEYNFPAFRRETAWLRDCGWKIFSPAERDENDPDIDHEENVAGWTGSRGLDYFMAYDLKAVCEHDAVICLPGWEDSQGARLETVVAVEIGHPVFAIVEERSKPNGTFLLDKRLRSINPGYIQAVFAARGVPERVEAAQDDARTIHAPFACRCGGALTEGCEGYAPEADPVEEAWAEENRKRDGLLDFVATNTTEAEGNALDALARLEEKADQLERDIISALPTGSEARKAVPLASGVLDYFPAALAEVARVSKAGNDKHNPGQPMHHARGKSTDHADCLLRHLVDRGKVDPETGQRHSGEVAWRALALLQQELEDAGLAPMPRGAKL